MKKAVPITHRAALWQLDMYADVIGLCESDCIATWLPLYHDMGLIACTLLPFVTGTPVAALSPFHWVRRPITLLELISRYRATLCWLPNFAYSFLASRVHDDDLIDIDLSSLRGLINSSEPVMDESHARFVARFARLGLTESTLKTSYAMAENVFAVTSGGFETPLAYDIVQRDRLELGYAEAVATDHPRGRRLVSSGTALPSTGVQILMPDGSQAPARRVGEIAIASPCLFSGYQGGEEKPVSETQHFLTGDLGYLSDGHLFVTGRKKDLIIVAGRNIFPEDIESIASDVPGVIPGRVVAFGVTNQATGTEDVVVVAETLETAVERLASLTESIRSAVSNRVDISLDDIRLVEHMWLRKSSSGKLSRAENRRRYVGIRSLPAAQSGGASGVGDTALGSESGSWLTVTLDAVRQVLGSRVPRAFGPSYLLIASGLVDSLTFVALVMELEHSTGFRIPSNFLDVGQFKTARHIARLLESVAAGEGPSTNLASAQAVSQTDDRDRACEQLVEVGDAIDLLILGSSKARQLFPPVARGYGFNAFNFWLANARAEDWYCAQQFTIQEIRAPLRAVVLLIDIEAFADNVDIDIRLAQSRRLRPYLRSTDGWAIPAADDLKTDFPDHRFDVVLRQFKIGQAEPWMLKVRTDQGSPRVDTNELYLSDRTPIKLADPYAQNAYYTLKMRNFWRLDERRLWYFRELLRGCLSRRIRVICAISPLHRVLDAHLTRQTTYALRLAEFAREVRTVQDPLFTFYDTRVPARFSGLEEDFLDAAHICSANADRLFEHLLRTKL
jgi:hypothetical protein